MDIISLLAIGISLVALGFSLHTLWVTRASWRLWRKPPLTKELADEASFTLFRWRVTYIPPKESKNR